MHYLFWLILSGLCFAAGEYFSKDWANTKSSLSMLFAFASYMIGTAVWFPAIDSKNHLAIVGTIWSVLSFLGSIAIGTLVFGEKLSTVGWVGVAMALGSIILLSGE